MKSKSKLVGSLVDCIYRMVPDEKLREDIYTEFVSELFDKEFDDITFLDECTEDDIFWNVLREYGMCEPLEEEESEENGGDFLSVVSDMEGLFDSNADDEEEEEEEPDADDEFESE